MNFVAHQAFKVLSRLYTDSRHARWAVASQVVTSGANLATTVMIVRALGIEEFGQFSVCFLLVMVARNFLDAMVLVPMSTIAPRLRRSSAPAYGGFLVVNAATFAAGSSLLLYVLAVPLGALINAPWLPSLAQPLALANFAATGADFVRRYHFVYDAPDAAFRVDATRFAVQLGIMLTLVLFVPSMFSAETALYAMAVGSVLALVLGPRVLGRSRWSGSLSRVLWIRHWNFIKWTTPSVALDFVQHSVPMLIGAALLGEGALGLVRAMQSLANVLNLPFNALRQIALSKASSAISRGGTPALRKVLLTITVWSASAVVGLSVLVIAFSGPVIDQGFHTDPAETLPILVAYCALNLATILRFPFTIALQALERLHIVTAANVFAAILVAAGTAPIIEILGPIGIPILSTVVIAITGVAFVIGARLSPHAPRHRLYNIYLEWRAVLARSDLLYPIFVAALSVVRPHQRALLVRDSTELVIEGFPRSANTYVVSFFEQAQGRPLALAHHLHESYQVRFAERHRIPCVVLVRAPLDSVVSAMLRDPTKNADTLLRNYIRFYREVMRVRQNAVIAPFGIAIRDTNAVVRRINEKYGADYLTLPPGKEELVRKSVAEKDRRAFRTTVLDPARVAAPSSEKSNHKAKLAANVRQDFGDLLATAEALYSQVLLASDFDVR